MLVLFNFDPPVTTPRKLAVCLFFAFGGERAFVLGALSLKRGDKAAAAEEALHQRLVLGLGDDALDEGGACIVDQRHMLRVGFALRSRAVGGIEHALRADLEPELAAVVRELLDHPGRRARDPDVARAVDGAIRYVLALYALLIIIAFLGVTKIV